jgi:hypothetical protein
MIEQTQENRSIIPTGYKDAPQYRSIEPQTLELLVFSPAPGPNIGRKTRS